MIFGKLIKHCKICIYEQKEDGGEIESFSLLKLSLVEAFSLIEISRNNIEKITDASFIIKYETNDEISKEWKRLCKSHLEKDSKNFIDVSKKYKSQIAGTSCLIRDPQNHIIKIAYRKDNNICTINRICIPNDVRERFFQDAKQCKYFKDTKKYALDTQDLVIYSCWSNYMNKTFLLQSKINS